MEIINWLRSQDQEIFFVSNYGSYDQDLTVKFYNREDYIRDIPSWTSGFVDYWNTGDCKLLAYAKYFNQVDSTSRPMWAEVAQNQSSDSENFIETPDEFEQILEDYLEKILSGDAIEISFTCSDDEYYALNTGVVRL